MTRQVFMIRAALVAVALSLPLSGVVFAKGPKCEADLNACTSDLNICNTDAAVCAANLASCQAQVGASAKPRFVDNGDGTVTDTKTGLMWEKKTTDGSVHDVNNVYTWSTGDPWNFDGTAKTMFLDRLNGVPHGGRCFAGHCDWRLPSVGVDGGTAELETIVAYTEGECGGAPFTDHKPCVYPALGPTKSNGYWSATTATIVPTFTGSALVLNFRDGDIYLIGKDGNLYLRAVRGGL